MASPTRLIPISAVRSTAPPRDLCAYCGEPLTGTEPETWIGGEPVPLHPGCQRPLQTPRDPPGAGPQDATKRAEKESEMQMTKYAGSAYLKPDNLDGPRQVTIEDVREGSFDRPEATSTTAASCR